MKISKFQENILVFKIAEFVGITNKSDLAKAIPNIRKNIVNAWLDEINKKD